ncbi:uncharacterized protein HMPREF1541_05019 [Cyphellophora europaea CBS 101466]|uniref:Zn(2)-C6 fungal-type domain-containing protein n=1 Tax=Cyphellophora europaea (strain CBS 101466) TaxID=1220924 RepID=W2RYH8_CYPE1|nr:uncharacterized protein HMPREF1541_05019 [Cyphellophora europaea CBS 101466]ETN40739.1 hypothetical protein HMPREF1541_05019 [Cyphellophora europaea CBS 101466]
MEPEMVMPDSDEDTPGSPSTPGSKRRSAAGGPGILKRAVSSPNVRDSGGDGMVMSAADKKRNKLGYHRTAVACGHCRRRKIRCIAALDDTTGRCQNCIRLKKECHFFPVDQHNAPAGRRGRSGSKVEGSQPEEDTRASSPESGVPSTLKSSSLDEQLSHTNGHGGTPISPEEHAAHHHLNYPHAHEYDAVGSNLEPSRSLPHLSAPPPLFRPSPYYATNETHGLHNPYPTTYGPSMLSSTLTSSSPSAMFSPQQRPGSGVDLAWSGQVGGRSISAADPDETYAAFPGHRAYSYPSIDRNLGTPHDISLSSAPNAHAYPMSTEYQQQGAGREYTDPSQFANMGWLPHPAARGSQMSPVTTAGYPQSWYTAPLPYVREEEDPSQASQMQGHSHQSYHLGR